MFNKPISTFYSFNILAVISWIKIFVILKIIFSLKSGEISGSIAFIYVLIIYYIATFFIFVITLTIEKLLSLQIKNKFITQNKIIAILRYIGLLIWFVPLVWCLFTFLELEFF